MPRLHILSLNVSPAARFAWVVSMRSTVLRAYKALLDTQDAHWFMQEAALLILLMRVIMQGVL